ncbi:hypothetical protein C3L33_11878, partial [Rhododendron williamsianum]
MPDNRTVESNGVLSKSSSRSVEEAVQRLKIQTTDDEDSGAVANSFNYPDRPGEPNCMYYMRNGLCGYGSKCRFNHPVYAGQGGQQTQRRGELPERVGQPDCGEGNACPYYMRTGSCKFGVACKFHHPQPASAGAFSPVSGPAVYGFPSSSVPTSSGPQAYIPVVLSPSEGIAAHGWNTYLVRATSLFYYSFYGFCKYGPTCKYDHPLTGYSYNSDLNFPTLPVFYPPVFPYQRNLPTVLSLELSPPKLASISDWVKKPEAEVNENPKLDTETPENASEHAISPQLPLSDSSELSHEQSD